MDVFLFEMLSEVFLVGLGWIVIDFCVNDKKVLYIFLEHTQHMFAVHGGVHIT